jgi:Plasmid pRiA4b ORF-3-like protein
LQIVFAWSDVHLHYFRIHGHEYGCTRPGGPSFDVDPRQVPLATLNLHHGERMTYVYNYGERISTGFVESTVNQVISKRFCKKQQMGWTPRGAHLLLQIRARVLNGDWEATFRQWYPGFRASPQQMAA